VAEKIVAMNVEIVVILPVIVEIVAEGAVVAGNFIILCLFQEDHREVTSHRLSRVCTENHEALCKRKCKRERVQIEWSHAHISVSTQLAKPCQSSHPLVESTSPNVHYQIKLKSKRTRICLISIVLSTCTSTSASDDPIPMVRGDKVSVLSFKRATKSDCVLCILIFFIIFDLFSSLSPPLYRVQTEKVEKKSDIK
jgi:hypothetical protein